MLILTRYNNQRIVVIAPDKSELWITATDCGLTIEQGDTWDSIEWLCSHDDSLSGQEIVVTHLETRGKSKPIHRIGIDAPKDYLILREELLNRQHERD
jgi:sRNA-binding carbon storage regulator CsrA